MITHSVHSAMLTVLGAVTLAAAMTSCRHKDLCFDHNHNLHIEVVYDWSKAPDANPSSMELMMYDRATGTPIRYIFPNNTGGPLRVRFGNYDAVTLNGDITDWAQMRNDELADEFEIYTPDAQILESSGLSTRAVPRAAGAEQERLAETPGMLWGARLDTIALPITLTQKTITLYPEERVCHYTVDIYDARNSEYLHGASVDATISGMAEGHKLRPGKSTDTPVTMPFLLTPQSDTENHLHGEFLTFGETDSSSLPHIMSLYLILTDGSRWHYTADVSQQVSTAPDPRHVHIVLRGIDLPKPITHSGGIKPVVDEWQTVDITLHM